MGKLKTWISEHKGLTVGAVVFAIVLGVLWLLSKGQGSGSSGSPTPQALSFPPPTGGGGGGGGGILPPTPTPSGGPSALPFSPDYSLLKGITDEALRVLVEQEYNLEGQINQATLEGNTSLIGELTNSLTAVQNQIAQWSGTPPPTPNPPPPPPPPPTATYTPLSSSFFSSALAAWDKTTALWGQTWSSNYQNQLNFWVQELIPLGYTQTQVSAAFAQAKAYVAGTGQLPGVDQFNYYLQQATKPTTTTTTTATKTTA